MLAPFLVEDEETVDLDLPVDLNVSEGNRNSTIRTHYVVEKCILEVGNMFR